MANDSRSSRKVKGDESSNSKKKLVNGKGSPALFSGGTDTSGLRRSTRETFSRKQMNESPLNMRKSERLEKRMPTTPQVKKKSERAEKQATTSPLRRSDRGKKHSSPSSSGSKRSGKGSASSDMKGKREKGETSLKQLTVDTIEVIRNDKQDLELGGRKRKGMNARSYKALFKSQRRKITDADVDEEVERPDQLPQVDSSNDGGTGSKSVEEKDHGGGGGSERQGKGLVEECNVRVFEGTIGVSGSGLRNSDIVEADHAEVEVSSSRRKLRFTEGYNDSLDKDGTEGSQYSRKVEGTLDDTAMVLIHHSKMDLGPPELVGSISAGKSPDGGSPNDGSEDSGSGDKTVLSNRNIYIAKMDTDACAVATCKDTPTPKVDAVSSPLSGYKRHDSNETCAACFKKRRLDHDLEKPEGLCSCETTLNKDLCGTSIPKDRGKPNVGIELEENDDATTLRKESSSDVQMDCNETICVVCKLGGKFIFCDGKGCKRRYHHSCLDPSLDNVPPRVWHCPRCVEKKIESGVHSVSEGIESILDSREVEVPDAEGLQKQKQYFVKYKGLAHVHNQWIPAPQLLLEAPQLLTKFDRKNQIVKWNPQWTVPHRLLKKRLLMSLKQRIEYNNKHAGKTLKCHYEWLVKWRGLNYEDATWEMENASFLCSTEGQRLITDYENRHQEGKKAATLVDKTEKEAIVDLSKLPAECSPGIDNNHLRYVNKLRECWSKGQSALVFDYQERITRVILFILSVKNVSQPFLVLTTSSNLSLWENEFSRLASSINVLVYNGNKENRESIRTLEFYGEGGQIIFQVLLSSLQTIVEDSNLLGRIRWEALIVDECQRSIISAHFQQIKILVTKTRMLLFNSLIKENVAEHRNLLSLLGSDGNMADSTGSKTASDDNLGRLKECLSRFIAYDCISNSSRFVEYWVPVPLSNLQLEQYCATLRSNSIALCSCSKGDPVGALRDIIVSSRKCCDHPYIVDPLLQGSITKDLPPAKYLDIGIKASGKLQLLDVILSELKKRQLRVLILFQPISGSGKDAISIGDILDDFVRQRFGQDSYERVDGGVIVSSKRQAALNNFNKDKGRFVFLLEHRACLPSIKLSSVDTIIIFDSDWNPMNDLRALQRITIDSPPQQINIFRLYACCTVEEKILLLSDHDLTLDSKLLNLNRSTSDTLLMWGASYLFSKLDEFHSSSTANISCEQSELNNLVVEILNLISQNCKCKESTNSVITRVEQSGGTYGKNLPLLGKLNVKLQDGEQPHMFWRKLLDKRNPRWKYLSASTTRQRKRIHYSEESPRKTDVGNEEVAKKQKKMVANCTGSAPSKPVFEEGPSGVPAKCGPQSVPTDRLRSTDLRKETALADKSLHNVLKLDVSRLCQILNLSEEINATIGRFLKYIIENHRVSRDPATILQAFLISLCWIGASLVKHKIDKNESLGLAKKHMNFSCTVEEAISVYSKLKRLKEMFLSNTQNIVEPDSSNDSRRASEATAKEPLDLRVSNSASLNLLGVKDKVEQGLQNQYAGDQLILVEQGQSPNCGKSESQMLAGKHHKEIEEFNKKWEQKKIVLQNDHIAESALIRYVYSNLSVRLDKLKALDNEFAKKMEEHKRLMDIDLEDRKARHLAEEREMAADALAEAKSSTSESRALNELTLHDSHNRKQVGYSEASEYETQSGPENVPPLSRELMQGQSPDEVGNNLHLSGAVLADTPETLPNGTVGCSIPTEGASVLVTPNSGNDEAETTASEQGSADMTAQPSEVGGSRDGTDSIVSVSPHHLENRIQVPAECETAPNEVLECVDFVDMGTPLEANKENNGGDAIGTDMPNAVGKLNDRTPCSNSGNAPSASMSAEKVPSVHPVVSPACDHPSPADLEVQNECPQPLSCSRMQDEDVQGNQSSSPQVDSPLQPVVSGQHDKSNIEGQVAEPSEELHLPLSTNLQLAQNQTNFPPASGLVDEPPFAGETFPDNSTEPTQLAEDLADLSDHVTLQTGEILETHHLIDARLPIGESQPEWSAGVTLDHQPFGELHNSSQNAEVLPQAVETTVQIPSLAGFHTGPNLSIVQGSDNQHQVASRMPTTTVHSADPLLIELERLRKEMEHVTKFHEDTKLRLKSECDKEIAEVIAQINSKYECKRQDAEAAFLLKRKELDANHNKVLMNKVLADAFRSKCLDLRASGAMGMQHVVPSSFMQQLRQLSLPTASRPSPVGASSSAVQPSVSQHTTTAPPLQFVNNSAALFSSSPNRPPNIHPITPSAGNLRVSGEIRAPAPHIQPFRPSTSVSPSSIASFPRMMQGQHVQVSLPSASPPLPQAPSRPPSPSPPAPVSTIHLGLQSQHTPSSLSLSSPLSPLPSSWTPPSSLLPPLSTIHSGLTSNHAPSTLPAAPPALAQASSQQRSSSPSPSPSPSSAPPVSANHSGLSSNLSGSSPSLPQASSRPPPPILLPTLLTNQSFLQSQDTPSTLHVTSPLLPQSSSRPPPFSTNHSSLPSHHVPISLPSSSPSFPQASSQQPSPAGAPQPLRQPVFTPAEAPQPSLVPAQTDLSCPPSQHTRVNLPATSFFSHPQASSQSLPIPPSLPSLPPLLTNPSGLYNRPPQLESAGVPLSTPNNLNVSALELLMEIDNQAGMHQPNSSPPLPDLGPNFESLDLSEFGTTAGNERVSPCPSTIATDVVCLSDDD